MVYKKSLFRLSFIGIITGILLGACKNDDFRLGSHLTPENTRLIMIDTLTPVLSLLAQDSVVTSGTQVIFGGKYYDQELGYFSARSFVEINLTSNKETNKYAAFDSIILTLRSNGTFYGGDSIQYQNIRISQLAEKIEMYDNGYRYSPSHTRIGNVLIDTTLKVRLNRKPDIEIKLPNSLRTIFFDNIVGPASDMTADRFLKIFPGIAIEAGDNSHSVFGYSFDQDSSCKITVYYHVAEANRTNKTLTFLSNTQKQYNQFKCDRSHIPALAAINQKSDPLPSSQTGNKAFLQSGCPLYTKIEFPTLNEIMSAGEIGLVQSAELIIRPVRHSYDTVPLPQTLNLYVSDPTSDKLTDIITSATSSGGSAAQTGNLAYRISRYNSHTYSFDVTSFITSQVGAMGYSKKSLVLMLPSSEENKTIQRLVLGNKKFDYPGNYPSDSSRVQLKILYNVYR